MEQQPAIYMSFYPFMGYIPSPLVTLHRIEITTDGNYIPTSCSVPSANRTSVLSLSEHPEMQTTLPFILLYQKLGRCYCTHTQTYPRYYDHFVTGRPLWSNFGRPVLFLLCVSSHPENNNKRMSISSSVMTPKFYESSHKISFLNNNNNISYLVAMVIPHIHFFLKRENHRYENSA